MLFGGILSRIETSLYIQTRSYIKNFWEKGTRYKRPGHIGQKQLPIGMKGRIVKVWNYESSEFEWELNGFDAAFQIRKFPRDWEYTEVKRLRSFGYDKYFSYETGRRRLMQRILKGEKYIAEM